MKNVLVCVNINKESFNSLKEIEKIIPLTDSTLTLLHIWNSKAYDYPGDIIVPFYPDKNQAKEIEAKMKEQLEKQSELFTNLSSEQFNTCIFSTSSPKHKTVEYIKNKNIDLVICVTPNKGNVESFFHSSFTNYLVTHAPCNVLVIR